MQKDVRICFVGIPSCMGQAILIALGGSVGFASQPFHLGMKSPFTILGFDGKPARTYWVGGNENADHDFRLVVIGILFFLSETTTRQRRAERHGCSLRSAWRTRGKSCMKQVRITQ